jgi:hypothetical protein
MPKEQHRMISLLVEINKARGRVSDLLTHPIKLRKKGLRVIEMRPMTMDFRSSRPICFSLRAHLP